MIFGKIKLTKDNTLYVEYSDFDESIHTIQKNHRVHLDVIKCFTDLRIHLVMLCELLPKEDRHLLKDKELEAFLLPYNVRGVTFAGSDNFQGVVISGNKVLSSKKVMNINSPFQTYEAQKGQEGYPSMPDLIKKLNALEKEAQLYLEGKTDDSQGELFTGKIISAAKEFQKGMQEIVDNDRNEISEITVQTNNGKPITLAKKS